MLRGPHWFRGLCLGCCVTLLLAGAAPIRGDQNPPPKKTPPAKPAAKPAAPAARPAPPPARGTTPAGPAGHSGTPAAPAAGAKSSGPAFTPPANAQKTPLPNGGSRATTPDGRSFETDKNGHLSTYKAPGVQAHFSPSGKPDVVHRDEPGGGSTDIHVGPSGVRRVETVDKNQVKTVSFGANRGYRERPLANRPGYMQRTYYLGGRSYARVYRYGRFGYPVYVPVYYYPHAYYVWIGNPWAGPVYYTWGAGPWFGFYGGYFAPAPYYAGPGAWMADYMISQNLQAAYAMQTDAAQGGAPAADGAAPAADAGAPAPIPADVRADYTQEVQQQVQSDETQAADTAAAPSSDEPLGALNPKFTLFSAFSDAKADANGQQCDLTRGDFVRRLETVQDSNNTVGVTVVSAAQNGPTHCQVGSTVRVDVGVLQDWFNSFVENSEAALEAAANNGGKNGFPPAPDASHVANPAGQATPDDSHAVAQSIQDQQTNATQVQTQVQTQAQQDSGSGTF